MVRPGRSPVNYDTAFNVDLLVGAAATGGLLLTMFTGRRRQLDRWEAVLFLVAYAGYAAYVIWRR